MNYAGEATDLVRRGTGKVTVTAARFAGMSSKHLMALLLALVAENHKLAGKTKMSTIIRSEKAVTMFDLKEQDIGSFTKLAQQYGIMFTVIKNSKDDKGNVDVLAYAEDAPRINRIYEKMGYATPGQEAQIDTEANPLKNGTSRALSENDSKEHGIGMMQEEKILMTNKPVSVREKLAEHRETLINGEKMQSKEKQAKKHKAPMPNKPPLER